MLLITGAPGTVGSPLVESLRGRTPMRIAARKIDAARAALGDDLDYVPFDFVKPETYTPAFDGIKQMFLLRPPQLANVERDIAPAVRAAVAAGVEHIVFLSLQGVERISFVPHAKIEAVIRDTGAAWTFLRAGFFMQNLSSTHREEIRDRDEIFVPAGRSKTAFIDARDIGEVAALTLTEPDHENQAYVLTGGELHDYYEVASLLSEILGRPIDYRDPALPRYIIQTWRRGTPLGFTLVTTMLYTLTRFGQAATIAEDTARLLGRSPRTLEQFIRDHREIWMR